MSSGYNLGAMQQVVPLLWIGNISAAYDIDTLRKNGIHSVVSVVNGDVEVHPTFYRHHIHLDDIEDADILSVLPAAVAFIEKEIENGRGVLVHCLAGVSRSATVTAAYLMYSKNIDATTAIEMIRAVRPQVGPNEGFLKQLDLFHGAAHKLSLQDKATRMYYLEQAVKRIKSGQQVSLTDISGTIDLKTESGRKRRIRCKMCRQELAGRENMLGHKISPVEPELPPPEPVTESPPPSVTIAPGPSATPGSRRNSNNIKLPPAGLTELAGLTMSSISDESAIDDDDDLPPPPSPSAAKLLADRHRRASMNQQGADLKTASERLAQQLSDAVTLGEGLSREPNSSQSSTTSAPLTVSTSDRRVALPDISASHPLADPACSGYFLEPMNWMTPFLESGEISGKLLCPNKRCKAKVGNFAWTGAHCSCGDWVVPGICIARGKVDEITI